MYNTLVNLCVYVCMRACVCILACVCVCVCWCVCVCLCHTRTHSPPMWGIGCILSKKNSAVNSILKPSNVFSSKHSKLYYFILLSTNSVLKLKLTFGPKYPITLCLNISKSIQLQNSEDEHFKLLIMLL